MALLGTLGKYRNTGLLFMRFGIGALMVFHGLPKLSHPEQWPGLGKAMGVLHIHFWPAFWGFMCAVTEAVGGLFTVLGLWFRVVAIFMLIVLGVAILFHFNSGSPISDATEAIELAFVYFGFLFVGPGKYSVDKS